MSLEYIAELVDDPGTPTLCAMALLSFAFHVGGSSSLWLAFAACDR